MDSLIEILQFIDSSISTKKRKHIVGGLLLSMSMMFGGLAFTILTIKMSKEEEDV